MEDEHSAREANKICGVCGDRALGYNFNAVTCESCKAFFRRNALKNKDFRCPFTENCSVTPVTRRFCQKCRLEKCFSIGMRKEYIMTEEDKVLKRRKIEQNRAKKRCTGGSPKAVKMKREVIDDINDDDESLLASSVDSTITESYFWESDRQYADLDGNRQSVTVESMSPVTAASVPSPSSPESGRDIIGSKTLDMQKDSAHSSSQQILHSSSEVLLSKAHGSKVSNNRKKIKVSVKSSSDTTTEMTTDVVVSSEDNNRVESTSASISGSQVEPSAADLTKKFQCPSFLAKLMKHPQFLMEIFQDSSLLSKLANNPNISKLLNENENEDENMDQPSQECLANNGISENLIRNMLDSDQSNVENPILSNLISKSSENSGDERSSTVSPDYRNNTEDMTRDVVQDVERAPIAANSIESILCEAIKFEYSAYSALGGNQRSRELNDAERAKLNELIVANRALLAPLDDDITNLVGDECRFKGNVGQSDPILLDVINLTAIAIRRLIKMSKKINAFKNMCQEDQLALLKGGCTEMLILRSALSYDSDKDAWKIPHSQESMSNIKADVLKEAKGNLYYEHTRFVRNFDPRWRDENIILILCAIALFTPDRPRVIHSDVVKLEQNSYYYLLRRYLESIYPGCEAKSTFLKLIQKISELHKLNNEVVGVYLNVNPSSVEPLLIEIFDLKH